MRLDRSSKMASVCCQALEEKLAENISVLDISEISVLSDYFVIASGNNQPQIDAMIDAVLERMILADYPPGKIEGSRVSGWILIDYGDVIVHIFSKENRQFYDIERIWRDAKKIEISKL